MSFSRKHSEFGRGPDKQPRKRKLINTAKTVGGVGLNSALSGVGLAATLPSLGLLYDHKNSLLQKRLAIAGLAAGSLYGAARGIQKTRQKNKEENMTRFRQEGNIARFEEDDSQEEVTQGEYNRYLFEATVENIRDAVDAGLISLEEGQDAELNAIDEYNELVAEELGYEVDGEYEEEYDDEEYEEYSDGSDMANFEAGNNFGNGLLELFDASGYDDLSEAVCDLAEVLGLDEEDAAGLLTGEFVPHPELIEQIADAFDLDDQTYSELNYLGEEALIDAGYGDEEIADDDVLEEAVENTAAYSRLENQLAEFQAESTLKDELSEFERNCNQGFNEGWLPPVAYREMMGSFEGENDRLVAFSQQCSSSGIDAHTQLFASNAILDMFRRCGPLMTFSSIVEEPLDHREAEIENISSTQAELNFSLRKQRSGN